MLRLIWFCVQDFAHGVYDAFHGLTLISNLDKDEEFVPVNAPPRPAPKTVLQQRRELRGTINRPAEQIIRHRVRAWKRVVQCVGVNTACIFLLTTLSYIFWFCLSFVSDSAEAYAEYTTRFFVIPVFLFTRIIMALWFSDIAGACLRSLKLLDPPPVDFRIALADLLVSIVLGIVFLLQSLAVVYLPLPLIARAVSFIHMSLLNSMYCFEYFWTSRSYSLNERIARLERRWPYFIGFGAPLTLATTAFDNFVLNGCVFGALFPFFIISSYKANWRGTYLEDSVTIPSVHIFTPARLLTDRVVKMFSDHVTS